MTTSVASLLGKVAVECFGSCTDSLPGTYGGFADFRKNATRTNSLIDRVEARENGVAAESLRAVAAHVANLED